jgi:hypothetical protein
MNYKTLKFSGHAIGQMFRRSISRDDVKAVIREGKIIKEYPDDTPYPSFLTLGFVQGRPIHIVFAFDSQTETAIIVTAYIPDKYLWTDDFRNRRGEL